MYPAKPAAPLLFVSFVKPNAIPIAKIVGSVSKIVCPASMMSGILSTSLEPKRKRIAAAGKTATGNINALPML